MSSSISSSNHVRFLGWVVLGLVATNLVVTAIPWQGILASKRGHQMVATELGGKTDFLVVGDSKAGTFSIGCLLPWFPQYRGLVFSADSVTPIFHYNNLLQIERAEPAFKPRVVFIFVGANNFNTNGQHVQREYTFFNDLDLGEAWDLSAGQGDYLSFAEALFSRILPIYGKRVMITHLQLGSLPDRCESPAGSNFEKARGTAIGPTARDPIADRNYYDIYRRSVYADYQSSPMVTRATEKLVELVEGWGGVPILVLPPVTPEIRALEHELIGEAFDETIVAVAARHSTQLLDLRDQYDYEFADVNHLSRRGARDLSFAYFLPILDRYSRSATRAENSRIDRPAWRRAGID